jgi:cell fate regulator YaaT (PSP1 superfamily)
MHANLQPPQPGSVRVGGVKLRNRGEIKKVGLGEDQVQVGDYVMLTMDDELTYGVVHLEPMTLPFSPPMRVMKSILRKATDEDRRRIEQYERLAEDGLAYCRERARTLGLGLKLVEVYCSFVPHEMRFLYTAPERIDFRQLVRDLARRFGGRIEMRHIPDREEAKRLGGVDSCGLTLCCSTFMADFKPVTIKHARAQGLPIEEGRLIGVCGRLKCCLMFEIESSLTPLITPVRAPQSNPLPEASTERP